MSLGVHQIAHIRAVAPTKKKYRKVTAKEHPDESIILSFSSSTCIVGVAFKVTMTLLYGKG